MDVTVIGCGYVGLVTGTCLASIGHTVRGVEKDPKKLKTLQDGHCPIFEPGLQELMQENYASGQLQFTDNVRSAVKDAEVVFLCVGTPPKADGTVDMSYLEGAGKEVCDALAGAKQRIHGDDRREVDRPGGHQSQAVQLPQAADQGLRAGRFQSGIPEGRHCRSRLPQARSHRHRRREPRSLPADAPSLRSAGQRRRKTSTR